MSEIKKDSAQQRARRKYERKRRGKEVLRVMLSASDDPKVWEQIKKNLTKKYGSAKRGILEMAKKDGVI